MMRGDMEKKLKLGSYVGYGIADLGNNIAFAAVGAYLPAFYSDVLGADSDEATSAVWLTAVTVIMVIARIWDAINDPIMGWLAQRAKPTRWGKFRHYLLFGGIPLALSAVLMFAPIPGMSLAECIVFAFFTYIAYGMIYTVVLVPYGSLATVMTRSENERSRLSVARSIGGGIGGVPAGILFPLLVYSSVYNAEDGKYVDVLDGEKLVICMAVIAVIMIVSYSVAFAFTKENYAYPHAVQQTSLRKALKSLVKNKPFVIMSLAGMLLIASSMYISSINVYLANVYYRKPLLMTFVTIATYAPMVIMIPFTEKIIKKIGKKEMCVYGLILSVAATLVMSVWRIPNPWVYLVFCFLQGSGVGFFTLEIWALAMDVIDCHELMTGRREEAIGYAAFTFMRKIGQAIAAIVPYLLAVVGYVTGSGYGGQTQEAVDGIYLLATVVPLIMFALMLLLMILYPLGKRRDGEMRARLAALRACAESCGGGSRDGATERTEAEEPGTDVAGQADSIRRTAGEEPDGVFPPVGGARAAGGADGEEV